MRKITKIVITGGPCGGKTTAMNWIRNDLTSMGYTVLFIPETATELITGGVAPWTCGTNVDYQKVQVALQQAKEKGFEQAAATMPGENIVIVCDRGMLDNKAYMTDAEFTEVLRGIGLNEIEAMNSYGAVFHLVTAAKGAEAFYTTANNGARTETPEQAIAMDDKLIACWTGHPYLRVIDNSTDFQGKMRRLIAELRAFLGEAAPYEILRKFLIRYPDIKALESDPACRKFEILQTYLTSVNGDEVRLRQFGIGGNFVYSKLTKHRVSALTRVEREERLTQGEYLALLMDADPARRRIRKTRYCLTRNGQYYEIDVFPFWNDQAFLEVKLRGEDDAYTIPPEFETIREVTGDPSYTNYALSQR